MGCLSRGQRRGLWSLLAFRLLSLLRIIAVSMCPQSLRWYSNHDRKLIPIIRGCHLALMDAAAPSEAAVRKPGILKRAAPLNLCSEPGSRGGLQGTWAFELMLRSVIKAVNESLHNADEHCGSKKAHSQLISRCRTAIQKESISFY